MSRDQSDLYSGANSNTAEPRTKKELAAVKKSEDKRALRGDAADVILELIEKEKLKALDLATLVLEHGTISDDIKSELMARRMFAVALKGFAGQIKQLTFEKEAKGEK